MIEKKYATCGARSKIGKNIDKFVLQLAAEYGSSNMECHWGIDGGKKALTKLQLQQQQRQQRQQRQQQQRQLMPHLAVWQAAIIIQSKRANGDAVSCGRAAAAAAAAAGGIKGAWN
ncbi:hypothetical protein AWZ03_009217 [Drosophila navojoa]|uniref:Uncharacterized protein n=1 Tax=Drosophila navojoa TaxID=7232 RepID=A0A484B632_DRONA|nr:hypothetical protein AWZ03_009217 [Drosophila navojoa]